MKREIKNILHITILSLLMLSLIGCGKTADEQTEPFVAFDYGVKEGSDNTSADYQVALSDTEFNALEETMAVKLDKVEKETEAVVQLAVSDADIFKQYGYITLAKSKIRPVDIDSNGSGLLSGLSLEDTIHNFENNNFKAVEMSLTIKSESDTIYTEKNTLVTETKTIEKEKEKIERTYESPMNYIQGYVNKIKEYYQYDAHELKEAEIAITYTTESGKDVLKYICHLDYNTNYNYEQVKLTTAEESEIKYGDNKDMTTYMTELSEQIEDNYREKCEINGSTGYTEMSLYKHTETETVTDKKTGEESLIEKLIADAIEYRVSFPKMTLDRLENSAEQYQVFGEDLTTDEEIVDTMKRFAYVNYTGKNIYLTNYTLDQYLDGVGDMTNVSNKLAEEGFEAYRIEINSLDLHEVTSVAGSVELNSKYSEYMTAVKNYDYICTAYFRQADCPDLILTYTISKNAGKIDAVTIAYKDISDKYTDAETYAAELAKVKVTKDGVNPNNLQLNSLKKIKAVDEYKYALSNNYRFKLEYEPSQNGNILRNMEITHFLAQ